jgi:hypothetical protein
MQYLQTRHRFLRHFPTLPFIYLAVFPVLLLDLWVEIYHRVSFPFYKIPYVSRKKYIKTDRHKLSYLSWTQKINCFYCGYANGVVKYWTVIFAETEKYWCAIQHGKDENFDPPEHHQEFIPYNDEVAYRSKYWNNKTKKF